MRKILVLVIAMILTATSGFVTFAANEPVISVSDATGEVGETVKVPISIANNPGIVTMRLKVSFNEAILRLVSMPDDSGILGTEFHRDTLTSPYYLYWSNDYVDQDIIANGEIVTLSFELLAETSGTPITVTYGYKDIFNVDNQIVDFDIINGSVTATKKPTNNDPPAGPDGNDEGGSTGAGTTTIIQPEIPLADLPNPFDDVKNEDWFFDSVMYVYGKGLMIGTADDKFSPAMTLTRAMVVTILYRHAGEPDVTGLTNPFPDVKEGMWYTDAIKWAAANGIVTGYNTGNFGPEDAIKNQQLAALIYRLQESTGKFLPDIMADHVYADFIKVSDYAKAAVNKLTMQGVFRDIPKEDNMFNPTGNATRAETAAILYRALGEIEEI